MEDNAHIIKERTERERERERDRDRDRDRQTDRQTDREREREREREETKPNETKRNTIMMTLGSRAKQVIMLGLRAGLNEFNQHMPCQEY